MPKRSASSTTITVASGTSTPTSITVVATRTSSSPARKAAIAASLSAAGIWPCSRPDAQPGQVPRPPGARTRPPPRSPPPWPSPPPGGRPRRPGGRRPPRRAPAVQASVSSSVGPGPDRGHRSAPGRELVEDGHVQVAEDHHGRRARDRRGRHHQQVGIGPAVGTGRLGQHRGPPLVAQRGALLHPEAVLLVDDHHAERVEPDLVGQQRVGADHHVHLAVTQALVQRRALRGRGACREEARRRGVGAPPAGRGRRR